MNRISETVHIYISVRIRFLCQNATKVILIASATHPIIHSWSSVSNCQLKLHLMFAASIVDLYEVYHNKKLCELIFSHGDRLQLAEGLSTLSYLISDMHMQGKGGTTRIGNTILVPKLQICWEKCTFHWPSTNINVQVEISEKESGVISYHEGSAAKTWDLHNSLKKEQF